MRIALCLTGLLGGLKGRNGKGKTIDPRNGFYWFKKNIIENNQVDIFFHTWSNSDFDLVNLLRPKKYKIEDQKDFSKINHKFYGYESIESQYKSQYKLDENHNISLNEIKNFKNLFFRSNSKWCSTFEAVKLKSTYEKANNFKYDFVVISRFDVAVIKKINFSILKSNTLYLSKRDKNQGFEDQAFNDLIFFGDSKIIDSFASLYEEIHQYSVDPIFSCYEYIKAKKINWEHYFDYMDVRVLRWNQHLMRFKPNVYFFTRHLLREFLKY